MNIFFRNCPKFICMFLFGHKINGKCHANIWIYYLLMKIWKNRIWRLYKDSGSEVYVNSCQQRFSVENQDDIYDLLILKNGIFIRHVHLCVIFSLISIITTRLFCMPICWVRFALYWRELKGTLNGTLCTMRTRARNLKNPLYISSHLCSVWPDFHIIKRGRR